MHQRLMDDLRTAQEVQVNADEQSDGAEVEPYENAYLGAFVYVLGWLDALDSAARGTGPQASASVLVQSGLEVRYGDLLAGWQGRFYIIEFKKNASTLATEWKKDRRAKLLRTFKALRDHRSEETAGVDLRNLNLADQGHFVAYGIEGPSADLVFAPYSELAEFEDPMDRKTAQTRPRRPAPVMSMKPLLEFLASMREGMSGFVAKELAAYAEWMATFDEDKKGAAEFVGLLVGFSPEHGVRLHAYSSINMLLELSRSIGAPVQGSQTSIKPKKL